MPASNQHEDRKLIKRFRKGDRVALKSLYDQLYKPLHFFASKLLANTQDSEDIVAEAFVTLWKLRKRFDTLVNIRAFLYITVRNGCYNYLRQARRLSSMQQEMLRRLENQTDELKFFEIEATLLDKVISEIEQLPPQAREVFKLFYLENLSTAQIAERMKLSRNTVQNHKLRAMKQLRTALLRKKLLPLVFLCESIHTWHEQGGEGLAGWLGLA